MWRQIMERFQAGALQTVNPAVLRKEGEKKTGLYDNLSKSWTDLRE